MDAFHNLSQALKAQAGLRRRLEFYLYKDSGFQSDCPLLLYTVNAARSSVVLANVSLEYQSQNRGRVPMEDVWSSMLNLTPGQEHEFFLDA